MLNPVIIQGGMGVGVSNWVLARAVSREGHLGVVSGTALDIVMARRLQLGDLEGDVRRALKHFPVPSWVEEILKQYFVPGGKAPEQPYKPIPPHSLHPSRGLSRLTVVANFVEVFLAKEGHGGVVGINFLEKVQLPILASLLGAMLAGVDYVLMGAGIPWSIPGILDRLARGESVELRLDVSGARAGEEFFSKLDFEGLGLPRSDLKRPRFLPIISSAVLAAALTRKSNGRIDGFVVEGPTAGGHNAPPRGPPQFNPRGEPLYGPKDDPRIEKIRALGLPFWLAGSFAEPARLAEALRLGAAGVQVGTAFAFCRESGIDPVLKQKVIEQSRQGMVDVYTDPLASPTGFPFKVLRMEGTLSEPGIYHERTRLCDLGYLRQLYRKADGSVGYRCPGETVAAYQAKDGAEAETVGRKCLCNGLAATIGIGQVQSGGRREKPILTAGDDAVHLARFIPRGQSSYGAHDVLQYLLAGNTEAPINNALSPS